MSEAASGAAPSGRLLPHASRSPRMLHGHYTPRHDRRSPRPPPAPRDRRGVAPLDRRGRARAPALGPGSADTHARGGLRPSHRDAGLRHGAPAAFYAHRDRARDPAPRQPSAGILRVHVGVDGSVRHGVVRDPAAFRARGRCHHRSLVLDGASEGRRGRRADGCGAARAPRASPLLEPAGAHVGLSRAPGRPLRGAAAIPSPASSRDDRGRLRVRRLARALARVQLLALLRGAGRVGALPELRGAAHARDRRSPGTVPGPVLAGARVPDGPPRHGAHRIPGSNGRPRSPHGLLPAAVARARPGPAREARSARLDRAARTPRRRGGVPDRGRRGESRERCAAGRLLHSAEGPGRRPSRRGTPCHVLLPRVPRARRGRERVRSRARAAVAAARGRDGCVA